MEIVVLIKQVPESEELRYDDSTRRLVREGVGTEINPFDKRALTQAMKLKEMHAGSVVAVTMGPPQAREALVECLGRGVDRTVHISDRFLAGSDTLATARTLAAALRRRPFGIILCGKYSTDSETGQIGPEVAELLDIPQVTGATSLEMSADGVLHVTRETDWGFEQVECSLPVLLTCSEGLIKPVKTTPELLEEGARRFAEDLSLVETVSLKDLGLEPGEVGVGGSPTWVGDLRSLNVTRVKTILSGNPEELAAGLLDALRQRGLDRDGEQKRSAPKTLPATAEGNSRRADRDVWAVAEWLPAQPSSSGRCELRPVSYELTGQAAVLAAQTGGRAFALLLGADVERFAVGLGQYGADTVLLADDLHLAPYEVETYAAILAREIKERNPWAVLLPATSFGRDLAPRVAARLGLGLTGDCLGVEIGDKGELLQLKPAFGGQVVAPIASRTLPNMATIRPGMLPTYAPDPAREAHVERLDPANLPEPRARATSYSLEGEAGLGLDKARLVVCVGTGVGSPETLGDVERLAHALGNWMGLSPDRVAVGGSRKVVDMGWLPRQQQIGITGHAVAPDVYLGLGVQGKFNHLVGILGSNTIVAVNLDPHAAIFEMSDLGIVSDWRMFADVLMQRLKREKGKS